MKCAHIIWAYSCQFCMIGGYDNHKENSLPWIHIVFPVFVILSIYNFNTAFRCNCLQLESPQLQSQAICFYKYVWNLQMASGLNGLWPILLVGFKALHVTVMVENDKSNYRLLRYRENLYLAGHNLQFHGAHVVCTITNVIIHRLTKRSIMLIWRICCRLFETNAHEAYAFMIWGLFYHE